MTSLLQDLGFQREDLDKQPQPQQQAPSNLADLGFSPDPEMAKVEQSLQKEPEFTNIEKAVDIAKGGTRGVGKGYGIIGDIESIVNKSSDYIADFTLNLGADLAQRAGIITPKQKENFQNKLDRISEFQESQRQSILPTTEDLEKVIDVVTFDSLKPQTKAGRFAERAGEFVTPGLGQIKAAVKGGKNAKAVGEALVLASGGVGAQAAEEAGAGPIGQLGGATAGLLAGKGVKSFTNLVKDIFTKGLTQSVDRRVAKVISKNPFWEINKRQINENLVDIAKQEKVDLPLSIATENGIAKWVHTRLAKSSLAGENYLKQLENTNKRIIDNIKSVTENFGGSYQAEKQVFADELATVAKRYFKSEKERIGDLFDSSEQLVSDLKVESPRIIKQAKNIAKDIDSRLFKSPETKKAGNTLKQSINEMGTELRKPRKFTKSDLDRLSSNLAEQLNKAGSSDAKAVYENIQNAIRQDIQETFQKAEEVTTGKASKAEQLELFGKTPKPKSFVPKYFQTDNLQKALADAEKEVGKPFFFDSESVNDLLKNVKNDLVEITKNPNEMTVKQLINARSELYRNIDMKTFGGQDKRLKAVIEEIDNVLDGIAKEYPQYGRLRDIAKSEYKQLADNFTKDKTLWNSLDSVNSSKKFFSLAQTPEGLKRLEGIMPKDSTGKLTAEAENLMKDIKRTVLEDKIYNKMVDKKTLEPTLSKAKNILSSPEDRELIKSILGKEPYQKLMRNRKLAVEAEKGVTRFLNANGLAPDIGDTNRWLEAGAAGLSVFTGNPMPLAGMVGMLKSIRITSRVLSNPEMVDLIIEMGRANKAKDWTKFMTAYSQYNKLFGEAAADAGVTTKDIIFGE